jgi:hypothetical protein
LPSPPRCRARERMAADTMVLSGHSDRIADRRPEQQYGVRGTPRVRQWPRAQFNRADVVRIQFETICSTTTQVAFTP